MFSIRRARTSVPQERIFPTTSAGTCGDERKGLEGRVHSESVSNDANLRETGYNRGGRVEGPYYQVDVVDDPACVPSVPPGDTRSPPGDTRTVMVSRTRQEPGTTPGHTHTHTHTQGPSFLRDELVKFIESAKLGREHGSFFRSSLPF